MPYFTLNFPNETSRGRKVLIKHTLGDFDSFFFTLSSVQVGKTSSIHQRRNHGFLLLMTNQVKDYINLTRLYLEEVEFRIPLRVTAYGADADRI